MNLTLHFFILGVLFLLSFFFSAAETSLFALSKLDKRKLKEQYPHLSRWIFKHLESPRKTLGTVLIGNLFVNIWATAIVALMVLEYWGRKPLGTAVTVFAVFLILFCEMFPKILAVRNKLKVALVVAFPLQIFTILLTPLRQGMRFVSERILSLLIHEKIDQSDMISEKELKVLVKIGEEEGVLRGQERHMIQKLLDLGERSVKDIMTPRIDMVGLELEDSAEAHSEIIKKYQFTHFPIFQGSLDHILGVVASQDYLLSEPKADIAQVMREPLFVPESKRIDDLLETFRSKNENLAICVDEHGGTAGIVTREDILEEIFGEFYDEYAKVENPVRRLTDDTFLVDAKIHLSAFNDHFSSRLRSRDAHTLGGYLLEKTGTVPSKGVKWETEDFEFTVQAMIRQRIHQILVRKKR